MNGVHKSEWGAAWTKKQGSKYVETLKLLLLQGKYHTTGSDAITNNYKLAVHEMAKHDTDFQVYLDAPSGAWKTRKYDVLY